MTVSRALRGDPQVTQETASRVMEAVDALGYQRNETARIRAAGLLRSRIGEQQGTVPSAARRIVIPTRLVEYQPSS